MDAFLWQQGTHEIFVDDDDGRTLFTTGTLSHRVVEEICVDQGAEKMYLGPRLCRNIESQRSEFVKISKALSSP